MLHGRPNVGKSSLFNALIGDVDVAITSEEAGTTRDYLTATLWLDDIACQIVDTAGRGETTVGETEVAGVAGDDAINRAADAKSAAQAGTADVELFCLDASRHPDAWEREQLRAAPASPRVVVLTKCDLSPASDYTELLAGTDTWVATSSMSGLGLDRLRAELRRRVVVDANEAAGVVGSTAARCGESLRLACESLERAAALAAEGGEELVAAEIRAGLDALGEVVGACIPTTCWNASSAVFASANELHRQMKLASWEHQTWAVVTG
ncbi:MAG: GTPase [Pirellulales bacterium]